MDLNESFMYDGICNICGVTGKFSAERNGTHVIRQFACGNCGAGLRFRDDAAALLEWIARGKHLSLTTAVQDECIQELAVYNVGKAGPVRNQLKTLPKYTESFYWDDAQPGEIRNGCHHQDLQQLTYEDASFDVVCSSHVLEHVAAPRKAFEEVFRVLKPAGAHIFSIPFRWPPCEQSTVRAELVDGKLIHHEEARYHGSPEGSPALVFTDFGLDMLDMLEDIGYQVSVKRPHISIDFAYRNSVFLATKPPLLTP